VAAVALDVTNVAIGSVPLSPFAVYLVALKAVVRIDAHFRIVGSKKGGVACYGPLWDGSAARHPFIYI